MPKVRKMPKMCLNRRGFGVNRWFFAELDDIELLIEIGILSNCEMIAHCKVCRIFLEWCLTILSKLWEDDKYIDCFDALKIIREEKALFTEQIERSYERSYRRKHLADSEEVIWIYKKTKDPIVSVLHKIKLFKVSINLNSIIKTCIQSLLLK